MTYEYVYIYCILYLPSLLLADMRNVQEFSNNLRAKHSSHFADYHYYCSRRPTKLGNLIPDEHCYDSVCVLPYLRTFTIQVLFPLNRRPPLWLSAVEEVQNLI